MFLFISGGEIVFILFIVIMVFGADKLPEIARGLGKGMRQLKDATEDVKREIQRSAESQGIDTDFTKEIKESVEGVKDDLEKFTGSVKRKL
ncbi:Sec-independent protein translocase subunit TatA/TatB [Robertkochia sediminum]|uniref:Sec-independent protein translocase subunit TatA/TatB n=1 Tax=Robertkochia sediminum TaxID=2785326 RepID=UPI0019334D74|nr:twin-arginine translocase TatA/TatE family subunit [Robertkochia sediminum]MBL7471681.1 twin-arginine translocase TatA/TatE family subunit [Robertkochia sediminum]